ncbi:GDSL lipase/esterase [Dillenia turbinata]|uniref:GDSL lipase/esterase n=1 Tax=Dillenia turbinata TaxID=194707 RepID=A0AAN8UAI5_9MAGN
MENLSPFFITFTVIFTSILASPSSCSRLKNQVGLFVFGDSLFDPGNNQYVNGSRKDSSNNWPYGESYFKHPTGRLSDGLIVPDFIAEFMNLPIFTPYLKPGAHHRLTDGANFAAAGAGVLVQTHPGSLNLWLQLSYFKEAEKLLRQKLGNSKTKETLGRAIYLFSIGGNDFFDYYTKHPNSTQAQHKQFVEMVIGNLTMVLEDIYKMGGRKFAFQNAGPLGCTPGMRASNPTGKCIDEPSLLSRLHNKALPKVLKRLETNLPGFRYSIFDFYHSLLARISNPSRYGFKDGKSSCCGSGAYRATLFSCGVGTLGKDYELCSNPKDYVFFDGAHPTQSADLQPAKLLWDGPLSVTAPYNVKQFYQHF